MDFIKETLTWINDVRAENNIGDPLADIPKGTRHNSCDCPIARALLAVHVSICAGVLHDWFNRENRMPLADCAKQFVAAFDLGELPQYEETA